MNIEKERKKIFLLRGGFHKEFAYKTMFREGYSLVTIDKANSTSLAYADASYITDNIWNTEELFEKSKKIYEENKCDGIINFLDSSTKLLGKLSDYYHLNYYSEETAEILSNKIAVRNLISKNGLNNIKYKEIKSVNDIKDGIKEISIPFVLKPSDRSASKGVIIVRDKEEIDEAFNEVMKFSKNKRILMEEFITGQEYCAEVMIINHKAYLLCISEKKVTGERYCIELVDITPAPISNELYDKIEDYLKKVIGIFEYNNGVAHIEFKVDDNSKISIIEINPRCSGGNILESLYHLSGYNVYKNICKIALNDIENIEIPPKDLGKNLNGCMLYNTFLHKGEYGTISKIEGLKDINKYKKYHCEKILLNYKVGDYIGKSENNEDSIGTIYLRDESYERIKERNDEIEKSIKVFVNQEG